MSASVLEFPSDGRSQSASRPPLVFRPSLHSVEQIVNALTPFYGPHCPVCAVFNDNSLEESRVNAKVSTVASALRGYMGSEAPLLVIG
ncbi:MAG: hypothetical protein BGP06_12875 [Rhizobiales bacterium 65-9]|nr:hypothetical protein [Hyphomicrobiales bacterium]OJY37152.1 MAG: hypothetical protein BGP06_12875 [Rhizobiales bacterium 65-9]